MWVFHVILEYIVFNYKSSSYKRLLYLKHNKQNKTLHSDDGSRDYSCRIQLMEWRIIDIFSNGSRKATLYILMQLSPDLYFNL